MSDPSAIRTLLIDDSPMVLHILQRMLSRFPEIQVVGTAANGREALDLLPALNPDVICVDLHMPIMDGLEFTREAMNSYPRPILVVSVSVEPGSPNIFRLLEAGAVDILPKPRDILGANLDKLANELVSKIRILSGVRVFRRHNNASVATPAAMARPPVSLPRPQTLPRMVVIGASTGGPQALREILGSLHANFPLPVVCVQHIGSSFLSEMVMWLAEICPLPVRKAAHGEAPQAGIIYFAPEDVHLELDNDGGRFVLSLAAPIDGHRPSVTVTMRAAARCFGAGAVGVLLTGMGRDGADGMADIAEAGGITIAQDEASSTVYGMPKQAVELGAVQHILPLEQIAPVLEALANNHGIVGGMVGK
jgi:two-component system chemotaxis response regulator CheB